MDLRFEPAGPTWLRAPGTNVDYAAKAGDPMANSAIVAVIMWVARAFPEAPLEIWSEDADGEHSLIKNHPLAELIKTPTPYHSGVLLWTASIIDLMCSGNAYWLKVTNGAGKTVQLWPVPCGMIEPKGAGSVSNEFITHYEYSPGGRVQRLDVNEVVHLRYGIDPKNIRKGLGPLASLIREIYTDNEAGNYTAAILKNYGMPGVIFSPKDSEFIDDETRKEIKDKWQQSFGGDNVGGVLVASGPSTVTTIGFSPSDMDLSTLRGIPEERITAVLGIPAAVVGFGAGLDQTKVGATLKEYREQAWENCIIPLQRLIAEQVGVQLAGEFGIAHAHDVAFDLRHVRVLQEDEDKKYDRLGKAVEKGWLMVSQAQAAAGLEVDETQKGYLRNAVTSQLVKPGEDPVNPFAPPEKDLDPTSEDYEDDEIKIMQPKGRFPACGHPSCDTNECLASPIVGAD